MIKSQYIPDIMMNYSLLRVCGAHPVLSVQLLLQPSVSTRRYVAPLNARWVASSEEETNAKTVGMSMEFANSKARAAYVEEIQRSGSIVLPIGMYVAGFEGKKLHLRPEGDPVRIVEELMQKLQTQRNFAVTRPSTCRLRYKTMVEFGSPNIAKPLHMGHLRSAVTGNFITRIHKAMGHDVQSFCFLGDWGTQFGLLQAGLAKDGKDISPADLKSMDFKEFTKFYVDAVKREEIDTDFKERSRQNSVRLEDLDSQSLEIWKIIRDKTVQHLDGVWKDLGIQFDLVQGESEFIKNTSHMDRALSLLKENGLIFQDETGCQYTNVKQSKKSDKLVRTNLIKADGTSLYLVRDLCAAIHRKDTFGFDRLIYVVDTSQTNHFLSLFDILHRLGRNTALENTDIALRNFQHVGFGRVGGQSTRAGTFSLLAEVIKEGTERMQRRREESPNTRLKDDLSIAKTLALSALIISSLKVRRNRDVQFDWEEALRTEGDTGVNLQYNHARLFSLLEKYGRVLPLAPADMDCEYILKDPIALDLFLQLAK